MKKQRFVVTVSLPAYPGKVWYLKKATVSTEPGEGLSDTINDAHKWESQADAEKAAESARINKVIAKVFRV